MILKGYSTSIFTWHTFLVLEQAWSTRNNTPGFVLLDQSCKTIYKARSFCSINIISFSFIQWSTFFDHIFSIKRIFYGIHLLDCWHTFKAKLFVNIFLQKSIRFQLTDVIRIYSYVNTQITKKLYYVFNFRTFWRTF